MMLIRMLNWIIIKLSEVMADLQIKHKKPAGILDVYRTTKCFAAMTVKNGKDIKGAFPAGFIKWLKKNGWWGEFRVHLCAGAVLDEGSIRVDIRSEMEPDLLEDARSTSLPDGVFDFVLVDPPYSPELAEKLYDTGESYSGINKFAKEAVRITRSGGLIVTLSYEVPKRVPGCDFIAICGIYSVPTTSYMRCLTVSRKR